MNCLHKKTQIWESHLAGARKCLDCGMVYNPNCSQSWFVEPSSLKDQLKEAQAEIERLREVEKDAYRMSKQIDSGECCDGAYDKLARSESKRAKLRNACELALAFHERGANINWSTVRSALAVDAAENDK